METENRIMDLSGYIRQITKEIEDIDKDRVIVFRGENKIYAQPCYPNLFRRKILDINPGFEKNQFESSDVYRQECVYELLKSGNGVYTG